MPIFFQEHVLITQLIASFFIVIGLSLIMGMRKQLLILAGFGGIISWVVFQSTSMLTSRTLFAYAAAAGIAFLYCEILSAKLKTPTTIFYAPAIIPLIPGKAIYFAVSGALDENWSIVGNNAVMVFEAVFGLAIGITIMFTAMLMLKKKRETE